MSRRSGARVAALLLASLTTRGALAGDAAPPTDEEDPDVVLSEDTWYLRLDASLAYTRAVAQYHPTHDDSYKQTLTVPGLGPALGLAAGFRLGSDVTLGGLGRLVHSPLTRWDGEWQNKAQGVYYGEVFIDHRLPGTVLRLGGGIGPGWVYSLGPEQEGYGGLGPVGSVWLGMDFPTSERVALGIALDATGAAIRNSHDVAGTRSDFDTFLLVIGISVSLRVSEPSWPKNLPSLARRSAAASTSL